MATKANIVIDQGSDFSTTITVYDKEDNIINLNGYNASAQIRKHYTSNTSYAFAVSVSGNTGEVTLTMNAVTTANISSGRYVYDCEVVSDDNLVSRILEGIVTITPQVTR
jgi:GTPase Era involved in 16S rRNA processing